MNSTERLKGLETFIAVVEAGSFTAAADRLNLTSSAVGKSIARLEERIGTRLFERSTRRMELTDGGNAFYKVSARILAELAEAERALSRNAEVPSGPLRIDLPATFGRLRVLPRLLDFSREYPGVNPKVSFTDRFVDLVDDGLDVVVRIGGSDTWPEHLGHLYLGHEELIFCASPAYLAQNGHPRSSDDLLSHQAVLYGRADGSPSPWLLPRANGPTLRQHVAGRITLGQAEAQVAAVEAGYGIAQLATWLVDEQVRAGTLVKIMPELVTPGLPLHIVWQQVRRHLPKVRAVIEHLGELRIS
ncbi:LysR substrate-binding domain-containing protein [Herbaspirillum sp. alder98]|uniref:LysR substrate-binding domain-containing protein n=1 Tax=Herbaspirillum sp. alder98 TaxID=2913096 RepID=UPI001CD89D53|nr:LysR substrate-binding domain-containing protein [Herbaspirillum sp. alder98]MCA1324209.1 LysR family transcriptional regulator [Herbaspirillum sp. alder98]